MENKFLKLSVVFAVIMVCGCATALEPVKVVWGSSTRALEKARPEALRLTVRATPQQCYAAVLEVVDHAAKAEQALVTQTKKVSDQTAVTSAQPSQVIELEPLTTLNVFLKDPRRNIIVLMGIPNSINTTEVGIFFTASEEGTTLIEVSSLSKRAKAKAAQMIFPEIQKSFSVVLDQPHSSEKKATSP